ncbi:hypothetical protein AALP_AA4G015400 [Arabis alpina]|uniref:Uncharacterized protein n=1 Tax=Arabis alpina TaxID=50452 RepID=A0A087H0H2_ARAAL|nr:hypothetical protein AALP_AA4G015400 [Arabis alpina]
MTPNALRTIVPKSLRAGAGTVASPLSPPPVLAPDELAKQSELSRKRAFYSSRKGKGHTDESHAKEHRVDVSSSSAAEEIVLRCSGASAYATYFPRLSASGTGFPPSGGLRHGGAYATTTNKAFERLYELVERNKVLEEEVKNKKDLDAKVERLELDHAKDKEMIAKLKRRLASADTRAVEAVDTVREEVTRGFGGRVSRDAMLLLRLGGNAKEDMLDLAEVDANLEFIKDIWMKKVTNLKVKVERLEGLQAEIYDAWDVFKELLDEVLEVLGIPDVGGEIPVVQEEQVSEVAGPTTTETFLPGPCLERRSASRESILRRE